MRHLKKFQILEKKVQLGSNILNILQELRDNGFNCDIKKYWTSPDFSPFQTSSDQWGNKFTPGKCSDRELKNGHVSYHIRLLSRSGLEFDKFQDMFDAFCAACDRIEELGKIFRKVSARTDDAGKIKPGFHIWFITDEVSKEDSKVNFISLISPALKSFGINFVPTAHNANDHYIIIEPFTNRDDQPAKNSKFKILTTSLKSTCSKKYSIRTELNSWNGVIYIYFNPI